ncbi:MAG: WD40 domain-containing protein [Gemmataceae bacterium]|nr:WD40 domain-containing protein [Gemmataceae bacterium]
MCSCPSEQDLLHALLDDFAQRCGEHPSLSEYTDRYPALAEQIRELFPAITLIEQARPQQGNATAAGGSPAAETRLEFSPDSSRLALGGKDSLVTVWDVAPHPSLSPAAGGERDRKVSSPLPRGRARQGSPLSPRRGGEGRVRGRLANE